MGGDTDMAGAGPAIEVQSMGFAWKDGTTALRDVNLKLPAACRSIVVGANGAGKTCMLRCIGGMYKYEGSVKVQNEEDSDFLGNEQEDCIDKPYCDEINTKLKSEFEETWKRYMMDVEGEARHLQALPR